MLLMVTVAQRFKFATLTFLEICIYLMFDFVYFTSGEVNSNHITLKNTQLKNKFCKNVLVWSCMKFNCHKNLAAQELKLLKATVETSLSVDYTHKTQ